MHGVMMPMAMFEQIMARWEDGLDGALGAGDASAQVDGAAFCFSWCPVAGCASLCRLMRPAAGAQRSEHRQRGAMASITTPSIPNMGIGTGDSAIGGGGGA